MTQCRYCGNEDAERIVNPFDLRPFVDYYKSAAFRVYVCGCCGGLWHWEVTNPAP